MSPRTRQLSHLMFPLRALLKGHGLVERLRELDQNQSWPSAQLEQYRIDRLPQTAHNNPASVLP